MNPSREVFLLFIILVLKYKHIEDLSAHIEKASIFRSRIVVQSVLFVAYSRLFWHNKGDE